MVDDRMTLGSLFSGSGSFELAGILSGIKPVWLSEIEPYPLLVTHSRLPDVKQYGDIRKLDGAKLKPVDIITFGSPCQDMSIAGKRAGLEGSRSNLFYEAVRVIKEMRSATNDKYPRYIVWENVPGVFSSNRGEDFRTVLEEICRIKDERLSVPGSEKWTGAGEILGDGFSVAWRVLDAQYWGGLGCRFGRCFCLRQRCPPDTRTHSVAVVSTLSQILQENVPEKYYLSPRACRGILNRAKARGKELPEVLKRALERQASA